MWTFPRPILAPHGSLGSFHQGRMEAAHRVLRGGALAVTSSTWMLPEILQHSVSLPARTVICRHRSHT